MKVWEESLALADWLNKVRQDFHQNPEPSWEERRTQAKIIEFLKSEGIEHGICAGTGVLGLIRGGHPGRTIGLRADIDAVKGVQDKKTVPYHSTIEGVAHSCGHDGHTAILMGVAKLLNRVKADLHGNVKLFFEPAEEGGGGARLMVAEGVLQAPKVDAVLGLHLCSSASGCISIKSGPFMAASAPFTISVFRAKHAGSIHVQCLGEHTNPVYTAGRIMAAFGAMQTEFKQEPHFSLVALGVVKGGLSGNTTDTVEMKGIIRTPSNAKREEMKDLIRTRILAAAGKTECEVEIAITDGYPALENNAELYEHFLKSAQKIIAADAIKVHTGLLMGYGTESFAYFSQEVPGLYYWLGGACGTVHGSDYDLRPDALPYGVALQCQAVLDFLESDDAPKS